MNEEIGFEEEPEVEEVIPTSEILGIWERVSQFVEKNHPKKVATGHASELFNTLAYLRAGMDYWHFNWKIALRYEQIAIRVRLWNELNSYLKVSVYIY